MTRAWPAISVRRIASGDSGGWPGRWSVKPARTSFERADTFTTPSTDTASAFHGIVSFWKTSPAFS